MLDRLDIQKLQDLPIEQVAEALGLQVSHHKALCPFHADKHPSLTFHRGRNRYRCFVCDARGGTIDLVMRYLNKNFLEACKWLADENNLVVSLNPVAEPVEVPKPFDANRYQRFFARPFLSEEARKFLYDERHLDARVIRWCRLTSWKDKLSTLHSQLSTVFHIFPDQDAAGEQLYNRLVEASIKYGFTLVRHQLPAGNYPITLVKCKQYARKMPCLNPHPPCDLCKKLPFVCTNNTLPCWCPMLKPGNGVHDRLDGSICVGQYNCLNSLLHPKTTFDPLYERIRKSISRGNQVTLSIKNPPPLQAQCR